MDISHIRISGYGTRGNILPYNSTAISTMRNTVMSRICTWMTEPTTYNNNTSNNQIAKKKLKLI